MRTQLTNMNIKKPDKSDAEKLGTEKSILIFLVLFGISLTGLFYVYLMFPDLAESEKVHIKIPWDIEDAKKLAYVLANYKDMYYFEVMFGICLVYIFLQTFAIPGSMFLSILSGFLYSFPIALTLICCCSAIGATLCYLLSQIVGKRIIKHFWPQRSEDWAKHVQKHRHRLFSYMLFLRMTPILPNWFINLCAPVIGVPLYPFVFGTFFGVAPPSFLAIQAGKTIQTMSSTNDAFSWNSFLLLTGCACLSLIPGVLKKKLD